MPGSLLSSPGVKRADSTRSDHSDISVQSNDSRTSAKKVSFNKAVRVKKYPRRHDHAEGNPQQVVLVEPDVDHSSPEKRFWFKVYKNRHRQDPDLRKEEDRIPYASHEEALLFRDEDSSPEDFAPGTLATIAESNDASTRAVDQNSTDAAAVHLGKHEPLHSSQQPTDMPHVRKNLVKNIVEKFNEEAVLRAPDRNSPSPVNSQVSNGFHRPTEPPADYGVDEPDSPRSPKTRKNPLINGVKVIFGMAHLKKRQDGHRKVRDVHAENQHNLDTKPPSSPSPVSKQRVSNGIKGSSYKTKGTVDRKSPARRTTPASPVPQKGTKKDHTKPRRELNNNEVVPDAHAVATKPEFEHEFLPVAEWDSGEQLVLDSSQKEQSCSNTHQGQYLQSVQERHRIWKQETRRLFQEVPSPSSGRSKTVKASESTERRALGDREEVVRSREKSPSTPHTHEKGVQCNRKEELRKKAEAALLQTSGSNHIGPRLIQSSKDGSVSAFSNVPVLNGSDSMPRKWTTTSASSPSSSPKVKRPTTVLYTQVDKARKNKRADAVLAEASKDFRDSADSRRVKTSQRSFGFKVTKLEPKVEENYDDKDVDWYRLDDSPHAPRNDIAEIRAELDEPAEESSAAEGSDEDKTPRSVIREIDSTKREISYENFPRQDGGKGKDITVGGGGLWYRKAEEDYRREMAQSEVSYPTGSPVGNDTSSTLGRSRRPKRDEPAATHTLDGRHSKESTREQRTRDRWHRSRGQQPVRVLVNGHLVNDTQALIDATRRSRSQPSSSSIQSDPQQLRGGLAAAYQARQQAAVKRSNSTVTPYGGYRSGSSRAGSSAASAVSSSDSELSRQRKPVVMYIPGVSHSQRSADDDDERLSGINLARSQSTLASKYKNRTSGGGKSHKVRAHVDSAEAEDQLSPLPTVTGKKKAKSDGKSNVRRRHSMPKDTKFPWFKWKVVGKPTREP